MAKKSYLCKLKFANKSNAKNLFLFFLTEKQEKYYRIIII